MRRGCTSSVVSLILMTAALASAGGPGAAAVKKGDLEKAPQAPPSDLIPGLTIGAPVFSASYDPVNCSYTWRATVTNNSDAAHSGGLQAYAVEDNIEVAAAGGTSMSLAKGETKTLGSSPALTSPMASQLRVIFFEAGKRVAVSPLGARPTLPAFAEAMTVSASGRGTSWAVNIKSNITQGYPSRDVTVQGTSGPTANGPWSASGGNSPGGSSACIPAQGQVRTTHYKAADHKFMKFTITRYLRPGKFETLMERVFEETALPSNPGAVDRPTVRKD